ncbi:MAG: hypothetical protein GX431_13135 [Bacteroidales bacterium]|jgi:uncharacterized membrane protein HdeD (DUF308 family)|nr:hypothetical protein [Bacteroidales bacterium]
MKRIRLLAGMLLLISGILHIVAYFQASESPGNIPVLAFGVIYLIVGALLFNRRKYPLYLAIFVPLIGMTLSLIKFGIPELISLSALFKVLEIIAIICCLVVLLRSQKN